MLRVTKAGSPPTTEHNRPESSPAYLRTIGFTSCATRITEGIGKAPLIIFTLVHCCGLASPAGTCRGCCCWCGRCSWRQCRWPRSGAKSIYSSTSTTINHATAPRTRADGLLANRSFWRDFWQEFSRAATHRAGPRRMAVTAQHILIFRTRCRDVLVVEKGRATHNHRCRR